MPFSAMSFRVENIMCSTFSTESMEISFKPQVNMVSLFSGSNPVESDKADPKAESIRAFLNGEAELPRRICSRIVKTRTSKESLMSQVNQPTQAWYFLEMSSGSE